MIVCMAGSWKWKYYIGQHTTTNLDDGYKGSGILIQKYYKKHPNDFIKSIICFCDSKEQLDEIEKECIAQCIDHPDCLNLALGGTGGCKKGVISAFKGHHHTKESKRKISESHKGKPSPNGFLNKCHSIETRLKISLSCKGKTGNKGIDNPTYNTKWMNDGYNNIRVKPEEWNEFIDIGYKFGRI